MIIALLTFFVFFWIFCFDLMYEANSFGWFRGGLGKDKPTVNMTDENK